MEDERSSGWSLVVALLQFPDVVQHVLRTLDRSAFLSLSLSCRAVRSWLLETGEELLRTLCYAKYGGRKRVCLLKGWSFGRLFFTPRPRALLGLGRGAVWATLDPSGRRLVSRAEYDGVELTSSPNGLLRCCVRGGAMVVFDGGTQQVVATCSAGGAVVYCYFDCSSSIATWIFAAPNGRLRLGWFDLTTRERRDSGAISGPAFFWHLSPWDPAIALVNTNNQVLLMRLRLEEGSEKLPDPITVFSGFGMAACLQVPLLVEGGRSCVVAVGGNDDCRLLLLLPIANRNAAECEAIVEAVQRSDANDSRLLHTFEVEGMVVAQSTADECVIAAVVDEVFLSVIEINLATRQKTPIQIEAPVCFFVSPGSGRFVLLLHLAERELRWTVYDRVGRSSQLVPCAVAHTPSLLSNRRPFQSAYALSHSPWDKTPETNRFCFMSDQLEVVVCELEVAASSFRLCPLQTIEGMGGEIGLSWFS